MSDTRRRYAGERSEISFDTRRCIHTEVPEALEGRGIAGRIVRFALDDVRARGLKAVPRCPYVAGYISRHPEYQDLVA